MIADRFGVGVGQGVATSTLAISFLILLSPSLPAQVVGMAFYSVGRLFVFAMYFSNLGRRFGFEHYGALAGTGMLCASFASLLQYPMFTAAVDGGTEGENAVNAGVRRRRRGGVSVHRVARGEGSGGSYCSSLEKVGIRTWRAASDDGRETAGGGRGGLWVLFFSFVRTVSYSRCVRRLALLSKMS